MGVIGCDVSVDWEYGCACEGVLGGVVMSEEWWGECVIF